MINTVDLVRMYTQQHLTLREIAKICGISHVAVYRRLQRAGILASDGEWVNTNCSFCDEPIKVIRSKWKRHIKHFCNDKCYYAYKEPFGDKTWRRSKFLALALVSKYYKLDDDNVVYFKDGDSRNYDKSNLAVLANYKDRVKLLHGKPVKFLWDGGNI